MQEFTKEFKAIKNALDKCWSERASKGNELLRLQEARKKIFGDIYLGKVSSEKKEILNKKIRQLKEGIEDLDIAVEELELRQTLMKRSGGYIQEKVEVKED